MELWKNLLRDNVSLKQNPKPVWCIWIQLLDEVGTRLTPGQRVRRVFPTYLETKNWRIFIMCFCGFICLYLIFHFLAICIVIFSLFFSHSYHYSFSYIYSLKHFFSVLRIEIIKIKIHTWKKLTFQQCCGSKPGLWIRIGT